MTKGQIYNTLAILNSCRYIYIYIRSNPLPLLTTLRRASQTRYKNLITNYLYNKSLDSEDGTSDVEVHIAIEYYQITVIVAPN